MVRILIVVISPKYIFLDFKIVKKDLVSASSPRRCIGLNRPYFETAGRIHLARPSSVTFSTVCSSFFRYLLHAFGEHIKTFGKMLTFHLGKTVALSINKTCK